MTGSASDPLDWQPHIRSKKRREDMALRFRDPLTPLTPILKLLFPFWDAPSSFADKEREKAFTICLEDSLTLDAVKALGLSKEDLFVCRATALDDTLAANLALQCRLKVL